MDALVEALEGLDDDPPTVVCLPDLFLDHFVEAPPFDAAAADMAAVHARGGGNLAGYRQRLAPGGNAANTARALARLGARAVLVGRTSELGRAVAERTIGREGVDLTHLADDGELALTVAFEHGREHTNVMLNHPGSVAAFGPADLTDAASAAVRGADAVLVANWTNTRRHGTALAAHVLGLAHEANVLTYVDTSDPHARVDDVPALRERVLTSPHLDVLAVNETELAVYGGDGPIEDVGARFAKTLHATLDVHTARSAHSWSAKAHATALAFQVSVRRTTGAGDVWNAGNLVGHLAGLEPGERLRLANAVAACYVQAIDGRPPAAREVVGFLGARQARST